MNRRGFIGSVLGMVSSSPFFVRLVDATPQRIIMPFKITLQTDGGTILAPAVEAVERLDAFTWLFRSEKLEMSQRVTIAGVSDLLTPDNRLIADSLPFRSHVAFVPGSTLTAEYRLRFDREFRDINAATEWVLEQRAAGVPIVNNGVV